MPFHSVCSGIQPLTARHHSFIIFSSRHYRYEQKLQSILWKIDVKDIAPLVAEDETYGYNKIMNANNSDLVVAKYRGNLVAMKKVNKRAIEFTRSVRKELNLMREVSPKLFLNVFFFLLIF